MSCHEGAVLRPGDVFVDAVAGCLPDVVPVADAVAAGEYDAGEVERTGLLGATVAGETPAPDMGLAAAREALGRGGTDATELGMLLYTDVYHTGPDGWLPHSYLQRHLDCADALGAGIQQGCNGVFGALEIAAAYLQAAPRRPAALIVASTNLSFGLVDRWRCLRPDHVLADGASAVVLRRGSGFAQLVSIGGTTVVELEELHRGDEPLHPAGVLLGRKLDYADRFRAFARRNRDSTLALTLMKARTELLDRVLDEAGIGTTDVARVLCNHGSRASVEEAVLGPLGVPLSRSNWDFGRRIGHVGASDQILALNHLLDGDECAPGDHVLLYGMGPGLGLAAAVLRIVATPPWRR
jgi:3-oxoacyl-[acyl-carrier-protein] synthase III